MDELIRELSKPEYANMSDAEAASVINAKTVPVRALVPNWKMKQHAILAGYWPLVKAGQLDANQQKAGLCLSVIDWIDDPKISNTDMDLPGVQAMIAGLVLVGLITESQAEELNLLGTELVPWTRSNNLPELGIGLIQNARSQINA